MNTLNFGTTKQIPNLEDHRPLADSELDAIAGGYEPAAVELGDLKVTIGTSDYGTTNAVGAWNQLLHQYGY
jgi:hypothetical protein